jgi:alanine racemase
MSNIGDAPAPRLARLNVDSGAIAANWRFFRGLAPNSVCAAVVKADGYGLGAETAAHALAHAGARLFFTATTGEALAVRKTLGPGPEIYVLNGPSADDVTQFATAQITPVLNSLAQIQLWAKRAPAALHIDTGMNRLGVGGEELRDAAEALRGFDLKLVMSHLACASDVKHEMNARQRARFLAAAQTFPKATLSLAATQGALIGTDYHLGMNRIGLGLYGSGGLDGENPTLATAARIEAPILQVREVSAGESCGYGATFVAPQKMRTATVALGYADGFLRSASGRGYGVVGGARRPILGRVSMDLIILDVTDGPPPLPGAMVEFLGPNAPLDDVAAAMRTAPYEVLTTFCGTVRRAGART